MNPAKPSFPGTVRITATDTARSPWMSGMPFLFVVIWSTGFVVAKLGLPYAEPLTFLLLRFLGVLVVLLPLLVRSNPIPNASAL